MTRRTISKISLVIASISLLLFGVYYFGNHLLNRYSPPSVIITKNEIISSGGFIDPVTIEKLKVDSFGQGTRPSKYTIEYIATCTIEQKDVEAPVALTEIKLNESGRYHWTGDTVNIPIFHGEASSKRIDSIQGPILAKRHRELD